ncbi:MAG: c-type cytochrome [Anaerolineae bacterium]|nr:c-type cytochrome [Anaerolineae bacterium]MBT7072461.1 c-type cytochrome [Anaerolineae bacterium]MBT7989337.1 c-type cytochrome [Anaerolineae bacterium]
MSKILKRIGIVLGTLVLLVVIAAGSFLFIGNGKFNKSYQIEPLMMTIPTDDASLERGQHLVKAVGVCSDCHGDDLAGTMFFDDPGLVTIPAPNLTSGAGGVSAIYTDSDWVLALRHGVGADGRGLLFMPSQHYAHFSDEDLGAMIAYLKTLPAVDNAFSARSARPPLKLLLGLGIIPMPVDIIDHMVPPTAPVPSPNAAYGEHLVTVSICKDCHGPKLAGATDPNAPQGPNLTPGGELQSWSEDDFFSAMRSGIVPSGRILNSNEMPWNQYSNMTDEELQAIWAFLSSLEAMD